MTLCCLLETYECTYGQNINMDKSSVTFSHNVQSDDQDEVVRGLSLGVVVTHDKYLGLPTMVGRNKRHTFDGICERVWKRVQGWRRSYFSAGGPEVLVKAVLQSILTYLMSIFQLLVNLCDKLKSILIKFWWGLTNDKRKIAWVRWADDDQSLAAKILKDKYFRSISILETRDKAGPSHLWASFMRGFELLKKGLRRFYRGWIYHSCFEDPWIPRPRSFMNFVHQQYTNMLVSHFILLGRIWDDGKLNQLFAPSDVEIIRMQLHDDEGCSNSTLITKWWNRMWNLGILPKFKVVFEEVAVVLWWIWHDRNACLFNKVQSHISCIVDLALNGLRGFQECNKRLNQIISWRTPSLGCFKLNADASMVEGRVFIGVGGLFGMQME
ncbi:uncharacterized protein LOC133830190 [Humulus lupulus]|uniref:uncharacterized protein LOC133830190 n=1 Tax=Humulus lupulus TaxID=3486 RepID=UPI002B404055|nr:uncharacterized protein LOC133830190 [Humulus lupulus]